MSCEFCITVETIGIRSLILARTVCKEKGRQKHQQKILIKELSISLLIELVERKCKPVHNLEIYNWYKENASLCTIWKYITGRKKMQACAQFGNI